MEIGQKVKSDTGHEGTIEALGLGKRLSFVYVRWHRGYASWCRVEALTEVAM